MRSVFWTLMAFVLATAMVQLGECQTYTPSSEHMRPLVDVSLDLAKDLREYFEKNEKSNKKLKQYLEQLEMMNHFMISDTDNFIANAFDAHALIKNLAFAPRIFDLTKLSFQKPALMDFYKLFSSKYSKQLPTTEDFIGSLTGMKRLVDLWEYNFDRLQNQITLFTGNSQAFSYPDPMDFIEMGKYFMNGKEHHLAYAFASLALNAFERNVTNVFVKPKDAYELLADIAFYQENYRKAIDYSNEILKIDPKNKQAAGEVKAYKDLLAKMNKTYEEMEDKELIREPPAPAQTSNPHLQKGNEIRNKYRLMCRDQLDTYRPKGNLVCRYAGHGMNPVSPYQAEQVNKDPEIWMFYDTVTESQARRLKDLAAPQMKANAQTLQYVNAKSHVFEFNDEKVVKHMDHLVKSLTGLDLDSSEPLQVTNYGIAGHYVPHYDYMAEDAVREDPRGNRLATFMTYLSAPTYGGETIFIDLGIKIKPIKLASLFWFNLDKRRQPDERTLHAACPVFAGHKWIANKWVRERKN